MAAATSLMESLVGSIIASMTSFATTVLADYWPYLLAFMVVGAVLGWASRFLGRVAHARAR